jgi:hypothetical protein
MTGSAKRLDWPSLSLAMDETFLQLKVDEIWLEDLVPRVIDRYQKISGHKVVNRNSYPIFRFRGALNNKALSKRGWCLKRRTRYLTVKADGEKVIYRKRRICKAFRIGEEE